MVVNVTSIPAHRMHWELQSVAAVPLAVAALLPPALPSTTLPPRTLLIP